MPSYKEQNQKCSPK